MVLGLTPGVPSFSCLRVPRARRDNPIVGGAHPNPTTLLSSVVFHNPGPVSIRRFRGSCTQCECRQALPFLSALRPAILSTPWDTMYTQG